MGSEPQAPPTQGLFHAIPPNLTAFEPNTPSSSSTENILLWIGGLFDTYLNVKYPYTLSAQLPATWSLAQVCLSSAALGWGTSSLSTDVSELSAIVAYFRGLGKKKVVIMGHSTGCQDCVFYFSGPGRRESVDGVILQASVSDREAMVQEMPREAYEKANRTAQEFVRDGRDEDVLPKAVTEGMFGKCPVSARRWLSLASPDGKGEDDLFSSDTPADRFKEWFGKVDKPLLVLYGEKDEYVPQYVDRKALVKSWIEVVREHGGNVHEKSEELLGGASHNLIGNPEEVVMELCTRVTGFLQTLH